MGIFSMTQKLVAQPPSIPRMRVPTEICQRKKGWTLTHILNTHHHWDHTGGNVELKASGDGVQVFGSKVDEERIPAIDISLDPEEIITFGSTKCKVIDVGGHTKGHIAFYFPDEKSAFVGDALFTLGCGRMFEGTPSQFWDSIQRLRGLPDDTKVYCAHEYTESNAKFALSVEPGNLDLIERSKDIFEKRKQGLPTVPSSIGEEKKTNPFLRGDVSAEIRENVGASEGDTMDQIFAKIRKAKDIF